MVLIQQKSCLVLNFSQILSVSQHLAEEEDEYCWYLLYCSKCSRFHCHLEKERMVWRNIFVSLTAILSIRSVTLAL